MATVLPIVPIPQAVFPGNWTMADLQDHVGGVPPERIRVVPPPGYATEEDVIEIAAQQGRLCELEDGVLVEKPMGWYESMVAGFILTKFNVFFGNA
jgi:hypothetical protein